jgi:hypothetical protein
VCLTNEEKHGKTSVRVAEEENVSVYIRSGEVDKPVVVFRSRLCQKIWRANGALFERYIQDGPKVGIQ